MRNRTFQMVIGARHTAAKAQIRSLFAVAMVTGWLINLSALAAPPEPNKGATLLLKQAAAVSPLHKLPSEQQIPELGALARANQTLPDTVCFLNTLREDGHTVRLAVHQRGSCTNERVVAMIHGVLADHETWRYVA